MASSGRNIMKLLVTFAVLATSAFAQWPNQKSSKVPRLPDGKANLSAPAPKTPDGHPDLSGVWQPGGNVGNIARDLKEDEIPFTPWGAKLYKERMDTQGKYDPQAYCVLSGVPREDYVPYPFKILYTTNGMVTILYEALHSYRQIFMDGRALPQNPQPTWMGYSVGRWEGDTLVVESSGFVNDSWLDNGGHPGTESMKVTERFLRRDFGHMTITITIE